MKTLKTYVVLGLVAAAAIGASAGCELQVTYEAPNPDAGVDSGVDSGPIPVPDAGDATVDGDAGPIDPDAGDATPDTGPADSGGDVNVGPSVAQFQDDQSTAFCAALQNACGNPAAWQTAKCKTTYLTGFANLYEDLLTPGVTNGGRLTFDSAKAAGCLDAIRNIPLPIRTAAQHKAIVDACKDAVQGKQAIGAACAANLECAPGGACKNIQNGTGTCAAIDGAGASCQYPTVSRVRSNTCSYHGIGETGRFCSNTDNATGVCVDLLPTGSDCVFDTQCATNLCSPNADFSQVKCVDTYDELAANGTCAYLTTP